MKHIDYFINFLKRNRDEIDDLNKDCVPYSRHVTTLLKKDIVLLTGLIEFLNDKDSHLYRLAERTLLNFRNIADKIDGLEIMSSDVVSRVLESSIILLEELYKYQLILKKNDEKIYQNIQN